MVRVVDCHAEVLGSNPGGPRYFPLRITSFLYVNIIEPRHEISNNVVCAAISKASDQPAHMRSLIRAFAS